MRAFSRWPPGCHRPVRRHAAPSSLNAGGSVSDHTHWHTCARGTVPNSGHGGGSAPPGSLAGTIVSDGRQRCAAAVGVACAACSTALWRAAALGRERSVATALQRGTRPVDRCAFCAAGGADSRTASARLGTASAATAANYAAVPALPHRSAVRTDAGVGQVCVADWGPRAAATAHHCARDRGTKASPDRGLGAVAAGPAATRSQ